MARKEHFRCRVKVHRRDKMFKVQQYFKTCYELQSDQCRHIKCVLDKSASRDNDNNDNMIKSTKQIIAY